MQNQFTPGPWKVNEYNYIQGAGGYVLAAAYDLKDDNDCAEQDANARLIAAAPALYKALKEASETIEALLLGAIPQEHRYSETMRAGKTMNAALALVDSKNGEL